MRVVFINIEDNQLLRIMSCNLSAKLASDRASSARYHYHFIGEKFINLIHIYFYGISSKKVFDCDILHRLRGNVTRHHSIHARHGFKLASRFFTNIKNISALGSGCTRNSQKDLLNFVFFNIEKDIISAANDRNAVNETSPLIAVIVNDTADTLVDFFCRVQVTQNHLSRCPGSDKHNSACHSLLQFFCSFTAFKQNKSIRESDSYDQQKLDRYSDNVICDRHSYKEYRNTYRVNNSQNHRTERHLFELDKAGKSPYTLI